MWQPRKFSERHPNLPLPGKTARRAYAQEEGGRRVAQGLVQEGEPVPAEEAPRAASAKSEKTVSPTAKSIWYPVDEDGSFRDEVDAEDKKDKVKSEEANWERSSSSAASSAARAFQNLDLRDTAGEKAEVEERGKEEDQNSVWSEGSRGVRARAGHRGSEQGGQHRDWRGGQH